MPEQHTTTTTSKPTTTLLSYRLTSKHRRKQQMSVTSAQREVQALTFIFCAIVHSQASSAKSASQSRKHSLNDMIFSVLLLLAVAPVRASLSVESVSSATMGSQIQSQQHLLLRVNVTVQIHVLTPEQYTRTNDDSFLHNWNSSQSSSLNVDEWKSYIVTLDDFEMGDSGSGTHQENSNAVSAAGETIAEQILTLPWAPMFHSNSTSNLLLLRGVTCLSFLLPIELRTAKSRTLMVALWEDEVWIESEAYPNGAQYSKPPTLLARRLINLPSRTRTISGANADPSYSSSVVEVQLYGKTSFRWPLDKNQVQAARSFSSWWWTTLAGGVFLLTCILYGQDHLRDSTVSWLGDRLIPAVAIEEVAHGDDSEGDADGDDVSFHNIENRRSPTEYGSVTWLQAEGQQRWQRVPNRTPNQDVLQGSILGRGEALEADRHDDPPSPPQELPRTEATPTGGLAQAAAGTLKAQHDAQNQATATLRASILDTNPNEMQKGQREPPTRGARNAADSTAVQVLAEAPKEAHRATPQRKHNESIRSQGQQSIQDETIPTPLGVHNAAFTETAKHISTTTELDCGQKQSQTDTIPAADLEGHHVGETTKDALMETPLLKPNDTPKATETKIQQNTPPGKTDPRPEDKLGTKGWAGDTEELPTAATMKSQKETSHESSKTNHTASARSDNEPNRPNDASTEANSAHSSSTDTQEPIDLDHKHDRGVPPNTISTTGKATRTQTQTRRLPKPRETVAVSSGEQALHCGRVGDEACRDNPRGNSYLNDRSTLAEPNSSLDTSSGTRPGKESDLVQMCNGNGNGTMQPKSIRENNWLQRLRQRGATQGDAAKRPSPESQQGSYVSTLPADSDASQDRPDLAPQQPASISSRHSLPAWLRRKRASEGPNRLTRNGQPGSSTKSARKSDAASVRGGDVHDGAVTCLVDSPGTATTSTLHWQGSRSTEGARKRPHPDLGWTPICRQECTATKPKLAKANRRKKRYSNANAMALPDVAPSAALSKAAQQIAAPVWEVDAP